MIAGNDLGLRVRGDNNGKLIPAIAVVINLAAATYWLAGALHVMGMTTTGATIVYENGAGLFHALAMTPPILALLALAFVPSNRPLGMLALLLNGALALGVTAFVGATPNASSLFFWFLLAAPATSATVALAGRRRPIG